MPARVPAAVDTRLHATTLGVAVDRGRQDLQEAIASGDPQRQGFAIDTLGLARVPAGAPLLYAAFEASPEVRVKAARSLGELALPDAAPKLRRWLAESGDKVKVELAAAGYRLGDKDPPGDPDPCDPGSGHAAGRGARDGRVRRRGRPCWCRVTVSVHISTDGERRSCASTRIRTTHRPSAPSREDRRPVLALIYVVHPMTNDTCG